MILYSDIIYHPGALIRIPALAPPGVRATLRRRDC